MENDKQLLWDLFCATGEPHYYSMYVKAKDAEKSRNGK